MDDTACSDEEPLETGPSPAASGSDRRTVARRPETPRPDPLAATVADQGFDLPPAGAGAPAAAAASEPTIGLPRDPHAETCASDAPPVRSNRTAPSIPGYEILGELGRGGMGVVYKARQNRLNRTVALKMILAGNHASAEAGVRFLAEAEAAAKLQHPNVVQIFHIAEHGGHPYFEMEFVGGGSLADGLDGIPRSPRLAADMVACLSRAIGEAHRQGIVHRDLKPANILLTPEGTPKVADFGLAKLLDLESGMTATGSILGSPSYMAPEQAEGRTREAGPAADLYALGAILYELLTGRPPFRGATVLDTLQQVKTAEPVSPSRLVPRLARDLETIVLKCLQKDPANRYESATALADDLRRYQASEPIVARPVRSPERAWRWCQRNPAPASLAAAVATLLVAVAARASVAASQYRRSAQQEERLRNAEEDRAKAEATAKEELEASLYYLSIALAQRELSADNLGGALKLLDECPPGLRQWEWSYLERLCRVEPMTLRANDGGVYSVAFSPDGRRLASANGDGTVGLLEVETGKELLTLRGHKDYVFSVAFHPDGRRLASASADRTVKVWDLTTGQEVLSRGGNGGDFMGTAYGLAFSPDGRRLAAGSEDGRITLWDVAGGHKLLDLPGHEGLASSVAFSHDGLLLASGSFGGVLRIWDARTGRLLRAVRGHDLGITAVVFHPEGRCLATASFDRTVKLWDAKTGETLHTLRGHTGLVAGLAFSRDGRRLASTGEDKTVKIWDPATGQEVLNLRGHTYLCQSVAFSPNGRRLASASLDTTIRVWDATSLKGNEGLESLTLRHDHEVWSVAFSPDGRRLASGSWDKTVKLWDAATGALLRTISHPGPIYCVGFRPPDGEYLASTTGDARTSVVIVWNATTGQPVLSIRDLSSPFCVTFSPNGQYLLKEGANHTVKVWDARTGQETGILGRHTQQIWSLRFSPDGRRLASASNDGTVRVWDWDATRLGQSSESLAFPVRVNGFSDRVAFTPDSRRLVTGGEEYTVKIWDLKTSPKVRTLRGHTGDVFAVAVSADGRWLASAGADTTVRLWNATTGEPLHKLRGHTGLVGSLAFSPDSRRLVSGSRDRTVKVWDLTALATKPGPEGEDPEE